jgi:hypothetical protein
MAMPAAVLVGALNVPAAPRFAVPLVARSAATLVDGA